ncbi:YkgJ family cysteine cluster protein [Phosphitispora sp. TUW77]|uniref:YkgJ family cysteine cluster protein n=1 Tax=Phosphitispora sp. TUW77 TaxID=3152361 RepID=UPI003AB8F074
MDRVKVIPVLIDGKIGYDIEVTDPGATVQEYIDAVNNFIDTAKYCRIRNPETDSCFGCDLCCQERIPVTLIDVLNMSEGKFRQFVCEMLHVYVEGRVVDITMSLDELERCRYLDNSLGICSNYRKRPLVCQTFICCPATRNANKLREEIINAGEDELVRKWFKFRDKNNNPIIHEGILPAPDIRDYCPTPFAGAVSYDQVKLIDLCNSRLWHKLTEKKRVFREIVEKKS